MVCAEALVVFVVGDAVLSRLVTILGPDLAVTEESTAAKVYSMQL